MISNNLIKFFAFLFAIILLVNGNSSAQWVSNPAVNTKLVIDTEDPINIMSLDDGNGGVYVIWEDKKIANASDVFFIHANSHGEVSFRADGKAVSTFPGGKEFPAAVTDVFGNALVVFKVVINDKPKQLFIQKLSANGARVWHNEGLNISYNNLEIVDYSIDCNEDSLICVSYLMREPGFTGDYILGYRFITHNGFILNPEPDQSYLFRSNNRKSKTSVVADYNGGAFFFWLENISGKSVLRASHVDKDLRKHWKGEVTTISDPKHSVLSYTTNRFGNSVYLSFQYQGQKKEIKQQLITRSGKLPWGPDGRIITSLKGNKLNPQAAIIDSSIYLSWTHEVDNEKDIFIQKFDKNGRALWQKEGLPVIKLSGDQFGQKLVHDKRGNLIITWIDRRVDSLYGNIYVQKLDSQGKFLWDSLSVTIGSSHNSQKSYLSLLPDGSGGAIAVFKERRDGKNEIYAHKIFESGTFASQVLGFNAATENGEIKISWYAANELPAITYQVQRTIQTDSGLAQWSLIRSVEPDDDRSVNYYEMYDTPNTNGTLYYRIIQKDAGETETVYDVVKVNYLESANSIVLAQNSPNPFSDSTLISFYLPEDQDVTFEFFDSKVELIKEIPKHSYSAGRHEILFKADNLQPGIYFCRFKAGNHIEVKKMVVSPN
ncbi:MAG: hypothetical protein R6W68_01695 [Ignavibacteriaceae bacterium]